MYSNNGRPPFVSLEKAGIPVDIRGLRHAVACARTGEQQQRNRADRDRVSAQSAYVRAEDLRGRLEDQTNNFVAFRHQVRALLIADFDSGALDLDTLNERLISLDLRPHEDLRTVVAFVSVKVVVDVAQLGPGADATDQVNALLRDAAEDACMSLEGAKDWTVSGR